MTLSSRSGVLALGFVAALAALCAQEPTARAEDAALRLPAEPTALAHYTQGNRLYRLRKFEEAIAEYQAGAMIDPAPVFDYNLGQCYRQLGKYTEAIWHYERFLKSGQPDSQRQALVTGFLVQMRAELERKAMTQPPTESASDPRPAPPAPPAQRPRAGMPRQRKLAIGIAATGGALLGLGLGLGLHARSLDADAAALCPMAACDRADEANALIERGQTSALYANVAYGVGGAAILGAAALWITGARAEQKPVAPVAIVPWFARDGVTVAASLRF